MKHSKAAIPSGTHKRPLCLWNFARVAGLLTLGVTLAMLVTAVIQGNHETWIIAAVSVPCDHPRHLDCHPHDWLPGDDPRGDLEAQTAARSTRCVESHSPGTSLGSVD